MNPRGISDAIKEHARSLAARVEYEIRVCIKPKPRWLSERIWLRIASWFIYVERTQPRFTFGEEAKGRKQSKKER